MFWSIRYHNERDPKNFDRIVKGTGHSILKYLCYPLTTFDGYEIIYIHRIFPKWSTIKKIIKGKGWYEESKKIF